MTAADGGPPPRLSNRSFGLFMGAALGVVGAVVGWHLGRVPTRLLAVAGTFALLGLLAPGILLPLNRIWTDVIAPRVGRFNNRLLLGIIYFGVMTPAAFVLRALGRDPLHRGFDPARDSYLSEVGRQADGTTFRDPF